MRGRKSGIVGRVAPKTVVNGRCLPNRFVQVAVERNFFIGEPNMHVFNGRSRRIILLRRVLRQAAAMRYSDKTKK